MTEYDFSPAAYERAREKHESVSRWVDNTKRHEAPNPFLPLPGEQRTSSFYDVPSPPPRPTRSVTQHGAGNYMPTPTRSYSLPPSMLPQSQPTQVYPPQQNQQQQQPYVVYNNGMMYTYPSTQTSPMVSPPAQGQYPYSQPLASSNTNTRPPMPNYHSYYQPTANQPRIVPIHGGTGGYVVVPAAGQKVQIVPNTQYAPVLNVKSDNSQSFLGSLKSGKKSKRKHSTSSRRGTFDL